MKLYVTMQSFAIEMQVSMDCLIRQFLEIGITKTKFDFVTQSEREVLFKYMHKNKLVKFNKLSLQRKIKSTLNISSAGGRNKQIQVEVRKKRVYMVKSVLQTKKSDFFHETESMLKDDKGVNVSLRNELTDQRSVRSRSTQLSLDKIQEVKNIVLPFNKVERTGISDNSKKNIDVCISDNKIYQDNVEYKEVHNNIQGIYQEVSVDCQNDIKLRSNQMENINQDNRNQGNRDAILKSKPDNSNNKLGNERRYHIRDRIKSKVIGKVIKQKRNNSRSYIDVTHELSQEEWSIPNRSSKNKRKQSTLVQSFSKPVHAVSRDIIIGETISVLELSNKMFVKSSYMIEVMMKLGVTATINQVLDQETAQLIIEEMGHNAVLRRENELEKLIMNDCLSNKRQDVFVNKKNNIFYKRRTPVVTIMGHVDHGKTSLLDCIRASNIVKSESGGITQKLGAYRIETEVGIITFLDTPGHEAFAGMRVRGIQVTDIVVLVVAADDGIKPQTVEAIQHIQSAHVPVVVAINKIDKLKDMNSDIDKLKNELSRYGLVPEEWGGNTQFVSVSAISKIGMNNLLDSIAMQSELLELKVMHCGMAKAIVIESFLDKGRGPTVTVLVREGILKCGDIILCGTEYGRVRAMYDELGFDIISAEPSMPVRLLGLSGIPDSGEMMVVVRHEKKARELALYRQEKRRAIKLARKQQDHITASENVFDNMHGSMKILEFNCIVKSDSQGSLEAICESLKKLSTRELTVKILSSSIGDVIETDSVLASASNAVILGFNVKADFSVRHEIESGKLTVRYYSVIYDLISEVKKMIYKMLTPQNTEKIIGLAKVHNVFRSPKHGKIAGCIVTEGIIKSHRKIKIIRNNTVIHKGELVSLRRFKHDVSEVNSGTECGIGIKNYNDICSGDIIEVLDISEGSCI